MIIKSNLYSDTIIGILIILTSSPEILSNGALNYFSQILLFTILPGHFLLMFFFPRRNKLNDGAGFAGDETRYPEGLERLILSIFSSIASASGAIFITSYYSESQIGYIETIQLLAFLFILLATIRKLTTNEDDRYHFNFNFVVPDKLNLKSADSFFITFSTLILVYIVSIFTPVFSSIGESEEFTEFYILGPDGLASDYPTDILEGDTFSIFIGIDNHESSDQTYNLHVSKSRYNDSTENIHSDHRLENTVELDDYYFVLNGQQLLIPFSMEIDTPGFYVIEFDLFRTSSGHDNLVYRDLQLNLIVA